MLFVAGLVVSYSCYPRRESYRDVVIVMLSRGCFVVALLVSFSLSLVNGMNGKCNIDDRVRIALRTMNSNTVPKVVDCVVGAGQCDDTGNWIRNHARYCQSSHSCPEAKPHFTQLLRRIVQLRNFASVQMCFSNQCFGLLAVLFQRSCVRKAMWE